MNDYKKKNVNGRENSALNEAPFSPQEVSCPTASGLLCHLTHLEKVFEVLFVPVGKEQHFIQEPDLLL